MPKFKQTQTSYVHGPKVRKPANYTSFQMGTIKAVQDLKTNSHLPVVHWALYPDGNGEKEHCDN